MSSAGMLPGQHLQTQLVSLAGTSAGEALLRIGMDGSSSIGKLRMDRPLKVALISSQRDWRGGEEQLRLLAHGILERGHSLQVFARQGSAADVRLTGEKLPVVGVPGLGSVPWSWWSLRRQLLQFLPDVLHANDPHALTAAGMAALRLNVPVKVASRRVDFPIRSVWRYNHGCDAVLAISRAVAEVAVRSGVRKDRMIVVRDGIDVARSQGGDRARTRTLLGVQDADFLLLCVAALTDHKGHIYLLRALREALKVQPNLKLMLAGEGELKRELQKQAFELGVSDKVRFLGFRQDIPDLLAASDLFVLASHLEGLCTALLDAMAAGVPVLATAVGGIPEALVSATGQPLGWLVPPKEPIALAAGLVAAARQWPETQRRALAARQFVRQEFHSERMVTETLAVYQACFEQKQPRQPPGSQSNSSAPMPTVISLEAARKSLQSGTSAIPDKVCRKRAA